MKNNFNKSGMNQFNNFGNNMNMMNNNMNMMNNNMNNNMNMMNNNMNMMNNNMNMMNNNMNNMNMMNNNMNMMNNNNMNMMNNNMNNMNMMNNNNINMMNNNMNNMNMMNNNMNNMNKMNNNMMNMNFCPKPMNNNMFNNNIQTIKPMFSPMNQHRPSFPNNFQNIPRGSMGQAQMKQMNQFNNNFNPNININNSANFSNMSTIHSNNMSNSGRMSNSGNENNFPFRSFNSAQISQKMNLDDPNKDIKINFRFLNSQAFTVTARVFEKLKDVVKRFRRKECPEPLQNLLSVCVCHGQKVDQNKTLMELNIKEGEQILFTDCSGKSDMSEQDKKENEYELTEKENEFCKKMRDEYSISILNKAIKFLKIKKNDNKEDSGNEADDEDDHIPTFIQYLTEKDRGQGIIVKEHNHKLVYVITRANWSCNICNKKYLNTDGKYYCSLCDFSMCIECHEKGNYYMKKSFPQNLIPSNNINKHFFKTDYHEHRLVYCRTSRSFIYLNGWICDNCRDEYHNNKWSFYCTACDFDLCGDCCGFH